MKSSHSLRNRNTTLNYKETTTYNRVKSTATVKSSISSTSAKSPVTKRPSLNSGLISNRQSLNPGQQLITNNRQSLTKRNLIQPRKSVVSAPSHSTIEPSRSVRNASLSSQPSCVESKLETTDDKAKQREKLTTIESNLDQLKEENNQLRLTIEQLKSDLDSVQFVVAVLSDLEIKLRDTEAVCIRVSDENVDLRAEITTLKARFVNLDKQQSVPSATSHQEITSEQQELNNNIVIRGIELQTTSCTLEPSKVYETIRCHLGIQQDETFNPVSVKVLSSATTATTQAKTIQVRFHTVAAKRQFLQVRRIKKGITPTDLGLSQDSKKAILITEQLTRSNQELLYAARSLRHTHKYKFVWSNNGQILVRPQLHSKVIRITNISEVNELRSNIHLEPLIRQKNGRLSTSANIEPAESNS